jgi:hypothetical protein
MASKYEQPFQNIKHCLEPGLGWFKIIDKPSSKIQIESIEIIRRYLEVE